MLHSLVHTSCGRAGSMPAAAECKPCKTDTSTLGQVGQTFPSSCFCKDGTYPKYNKKSLEECLLCPTGATCKRPNNTVDGQIDGMISIMMV